MNVNEKIGNISRTLEEAAKGASFAAPGHGFLVSTKAIEKKLNKSKADASQIAILLKQISKLLTSKVIANVVKLRGNEHDQEKAAEVIRKIFADVWSDARVMLNALEGLSKGSSQSAAHFISGQLATRAKR